MAPAVAPKLPDPSLEEVLIQPVQDYVTAVLVPAAGAVPERVAAALTPIEAVAAVVELPVAGSQQCSEPTSEPLLDQWSVEAQP